MDESVRLVIERARQLAEQLIEHRGHSNPPFLPEEYAPLQSVKAIMKSDLGQSSGVLLRYPDGYVIKVNANQHIVRQNFSCAHEIGHVLLDDLNLVPQVEEVAYRTFNPQANGEARAKARERLCDIAATELLMPSFVFKEYLSSFGASVHAVERLAHVFRVSITSAAMRIAEISSEPCLALLWQPLRGPKPPCLRLSWCVGPSTNAGIVRNAPVHTQVRMPSSLHRAYDENASVKSFRQFRLGNTIKRLPTESKGFGSGENRYVISLAFPSR
ncbi:MAG: ImmA/IrrE family metallo-endopeptidase [Chloroflexi bacterium]|nr:ImmA/IrrE family metallo-endopeptidase [Chloroflexota bacterium]